MRSHIIQAFGLAVLLCGPVMGSSNDIRVGLFQKELPNHFWISSAGGLRIIDLGSAKTVLHLPGNKPLAMEKSGMNVHLATSEASIGEWTSVRIEPMDATDAVVVGTEVMGSRPFHGVIEVQARPRELLAVNVVTENDYLNAVVADEMPSSWPPDALKAQAVVARTYVRKNRGRHRTDDYDFCDLAHCQVYQGMSKGNSKIRAAVLDTEDQVLTYTGALIEAFFHSTCGGRTASVEDVWGGKARPYLTGQTDFDGITDFCRSSPDYEWTIQMSKQDLTDMLRPAFEGKVDPGTLQSLEIRSTDPSDRAKEIQIEFSHGSMMITGDKFYLLWGRSHRWHQLKSTMFEISQWNDRIEFRGRGLGHGLGMCQWGAYGRAQKGLGYREILAH